MTNIKEQLRDMYEAPTLEECKKRKDQIVKKIQRIRTKSNESFR